MSYEDAMARLASRYASVDARRAEADEWHERQVAAAARAEREAGAALAAAETELAAARALVERIDHEAEDLWGRTVRRLGTAASRHGGVPSPVTLATGESYNPDQLLEGTRDLLDKEWRPGKMPASAYPLLMLWSALGAAVAFGLREAARWAGREYGGDLAVGLPVLALVVTILGPLAGLWPAKVVADHRHVTLDPATFAVVVATGLATLTALLLIW
ncbi:hypothetical protein [Micromonospora sp. CPCC 206061]|uniref:hypothetical protein n=1 Tax=Micromonospora sp. CPCC 206061 TaxID=3122410 RepID=UPI002FF2DDDE